MKKATLILVVLCVVAAFAYDFVKSPFNYKWEGTWVNTELSQLWVDQGSAVSGSCNKPTWGPYPFTNHLSLAQWLNFSIEGTYNYWRVAKPGIYCAMGPKLVLSSNGTFTIHFTFGNLYNPVSGSVIEKYFWWGPNDDPPPVGGTDWETYWSPAGSFTQTVDSLHWGAWLWERVDVGDNDHCCEYENVGSFWITADQQKPWIDADGNIITTAPITVPE